MQQWLPVPDYVGTYEVSDDGRVRSLDRQVRRRDGWLTVKGRELSQYPKPPQGYWVVGLSQRGRTRTITVHTLVLLAFVGTRPKGMECLHRDGNLDNNHLSNLSWGKPSENRRDCVKHGTHVQARKIKCKRGHEFTPENTYINPSSGGRQCRQCIRDARGHQASMNFMAAIARSIK